MKNGTEFTLFAKFILFVFALFAFPLVSFAQDAEVPVAPSAEDFGKSMDRSFSISPDGRWVAFFSGPNENAALTLLDLVKGTEEPIATGDKVKPRSVYFADNKHLLINVSFFFDADKTSQKSILKYELFRTLSYNLETKKVANLMPDDRLEFNTNVSIEHVDTANNRVIVSGFLMRPALELNDIEVDPELSLYYSDLDSGKGKNIAIGKKYTREFFLDNDGAPRLRLDIDVLGNRSTLFKLNGKIWDKFLEWNDETGMPFDFEGFLDKDNMLITESVDGVVVAFKYNIETKTKNRFFPDNIDSVSTILKDPRTKKPIAIVFEDENKPVYWIDESLSKNQTALDKTFKNKQVTIFDWDDSHTKFLIGVDSGNFYPRVYLFDASAKQVSELSIIPDSFLNYQLPEKTLQKFKASDGLEIPVYVTKPAKIEKPMAAVVLPHGGPKASDSPGFDDLAQFIASRGYVVIQPQFRGSTGFGAEFAYAGYGEWAGKMQSDVNEAFDWAVSQKWIDPKKTCIVGASYGGYSAMVAATMTPNKYVCASSLGGVFDLAAMQYTVEAKSGEASGALAYWKDHIGFSKYDTKQIRAISPAYLAENIKIPVQIIHAIEDTTVLIDQSRAMSKAMKKAGIAHEYIEIPGEDHWLSTQQGKVKYFTELERFLKKNIGAKQ